MTGRSDHALGAVAGSPLAIAVFERVLALLQAMGPVEVRPSKTQVAFGRRRGFAYVWRPQIHLGRPAAEVVLSIALGREVDSRRFKQVVRPTRAHWLHHLEIASLDELDGEVEGWLREAADRAG